MRIVRTVAEVREALREPRSRGERIGLVPTMGAFHAGHLALMRAAREASDVVVVSLFVNPSQFNAADDLARYPRDEAADARVAEAEGVDLLFAPSADELYPPGFDTWVDPGRAGDVLEGAARPGHFRGVATVCTKLFSIVGPAAAWFGQKDAQQVAVVRQVVADLDLPLEIRGAADRARPGRPGAVVAERLPIAAERAVGARPAAGARGRDGGARGGGRSGGRGARGARRPSAALTVDYVAVADFDVPTLVAAVRVGATRLIDNVAASLTTARPRRTLRDDG